ncbi:hypothetical protein L9F63_009294, partial [Diploptera punctata]
TRLCIMILCYYLIICNGKLPHLQFPSKAENAMIAVKDLPSGRITMDGYICLTSRSSSLPPWKHWEKGGGEKHHSDHHSSHGHKGDKGYKGHHGHEKGEKGHHDKAGHSGHYDEHGGHKKSHHDEGGYYGEHHKGEKGEKGHKYGEKGGFNKGHSTKGHHEVHKLDEYKKNRNSTMNTTMKDITRNMEDITTNTVIRREVITRADITNQDIMMTIMERKDIMRRDTTFMITRVTKVPEDTSLTMGTMKIMERKADMMTIRNGDLAAAMVDT